MSDKLGFTFYPKDWWVSDTYFELTPIQRYIYLECLFVMYSNDGFMKTQKTQIENRLRTQISNEDWEMVVSRFVEENGMFTHQSVNKRLRKTVANRENGKKGGRPKKNDSENGQNSGYEKPKKPNSGTQNNPPLEREREREGEKEREEEEEEEKKQKEKNVVDEFPLLKPNPWGSYNSMEDVKSVLMVSTIWHGDYATSSGIKNPEDIPKWITKFFVHAAATGKDHRSLGEAKAHCVAWTRKQIEAGRSHINQTEENLDVNPPNHQGRDRELSGKWIWLNGGWRDTSMFTKHQKRKYGL